MLVPNLSTITEYVVTHNGSNGAETVWRYPASDHVAGLTDAVAKFLYLYSAGAAYEAEPGDVDTDVSSFPMNPSDWDAMTYNVTDGTAKFGFVEILGDSAVVEISFVASIEKDGI